MAEHITICGQSPNLYPSDPWTMFGKYYKNVYIEDCYFEGCRHAVVGNWAGAYVLRYSTIEDQGMYAALTTGHPVRTDVLGMLTQEIYNVTVRNTGKYVSKHPGFHVEGGSALIYDNIIEDTGDAAFSLGDCEANNPDIRSFPPLKPSTLNILVLGASSSIGICKTVLSIPAPKIFSPFLGTVIFTL
ncbi:unnamed protein product [marine sediment metagenome]|uniref:Right handed beta helix domain-containing protein n=1 Tax=marine sediment metagenome TaxID=412755 RepID=X1QTX8_9ZZZZ